MLYNSLYNKKPCKYEENPYTLRLLQLIVRNLHNFSFFFYLESIVYHYDQGTYLYGFVLGKSTFLLEGSVHKLSLFQPLPL